MADAATFIILVKAVGSGPSEGGGANSSALTDFQTALSNALQKTGSKLKSAYAAQGPYDFIVDVTVDSQSYIERNPAEDPTGVTAQHVAVGFAGALSHGGVYDTETVSVVSLKDKALLRVFHSCTEEL